MRDRHQKSLRQKIRPPSQKVGHGRVLQYGVRIGNPLFDPNLVAVFSLTNASPEHFASSLLYPMVWQEVHSRRAEQFNGPLPFSRFPDHFRLIVDEGGLLGIRPGIPLPAYFFPSSVKSNVGILISSQGLIVLHVS